MNNSNVGGKVKALEPGNQMKCNRKQETRFWYKALVYPAIDWFLMDQISQAGSDSRLTEGPS